METTYKFDIVQVFTSNVNINGISEDLVDRIEFSLIGYKGDQNTFEIAEVFIPNVSKSIIPYNQLSKDDLISWVKQFISNIKVEEMKLKINSRLDEMIAHFDQFKTDSFDSLSKPTLPPWAVIDIPLDVFKVDIKPTIPEGV